MTEPCVVEQKVPQILNICFSHSLTPIYTAWDRSHMTSSLGEGGKGVKWRRMMKLVIFLMGNIIQILLTRGEGGFKGPFSG